MQRLLVLVTALAVAGLTIAPASVPAADQSVNHFVDSGTFVDNDFCGTGQTVNGSFSVRVNEFLTPNKPNTDFKNTTSGNTYLTNPANGLTVVVHFAGQFTAQVVSSGPDGFTELDTTIGAPEVIKTPHGRVLTRDAGYIQFLNTFDSNGDFVNMQVVIDRGPHPEAESDFALFCNVVPAALGL